MSPAVVEALRAQELFWVLVPEELGGGGTSLLEAASFIEEMACADGSTGWSYMVGVTSTALGAAMLGDEAVRVLFGGAERAILAGMLGPRGRAVPDGDGFRFGGRFSFGSGAAHASWIGSGAIVERDGQPGRLPDGRPDHRAFVVSIDKVELLDNWDVLGLQGTGSVDYDVPEQFVPSAYTFSMAEPTPLRGRPLFRVGVKGVAALGHAAVALGIARRALREAAGIARGKARPGLPAVADQQMFRYEFARHDAAVRAARAFVREVFGAAEAAAAAEQGVTPTQHQRLRQACTHVHLVGAEAVRFAYGWAGTDALRRPSVLGRCLVDMAGATQHFYVDPSSLVDGAPLFMDDTHL